MPSPETCRFGPMLPNHPCVGRICPGCHDPIAPGDYTALVAIGPGPDSDARAKARAGQVYNAVAVVCHYACVTGVEG